MDADLKQQVADRLKQATNILVTVKTDPSIDLLAACLGLSLVLDKIGKHATAVFSGQVPSAIEFLKPEETIEQTPNSLRDFIISLDKSKADKLRYKVEDKVVRIFITPFKAGLTQDDLEFSQGDFNIDLLVALGVHEQAELDSAVTAHGRILHDAAVISINTTPNGNLGTLNWVDTSVSSVSEMIADLANVLDKTVFDEQIATALLTGIVAETARFSNDKTSPQTMQLAGQLMSAGANQQLVATELQATMNVGAPGSVKADMKPADDNGTLEIKHSATTEESPEPVKAGKSDKKTIEPPKEAEPEKEPEEPVLPEPKPEAAAPKAPAEPIESIQPNAREILPMPDPAHAGDDEVSDVADNSFSGSDHDEDHTNAGKAYLIDKPEGATEPAAKPADTHELPPIPQTSSPADDTSVLPPIVIPEPTASTTTTPPSDEHKDETLEAIEKSVDSPHTSAAPQVARVDDARQQVLDALKQGPQPLEPLASLNAQPLGGPLAHDDASASTSVASSSQPDGDQPAQPVSIEVDTEGNLSTLAPPVAPVATPPANDIPLPPVAAQPLPTPTNDVQASSTIAPPPVPPPMMPPAFGP